MVTRGDPEARRPSLPQWWYGIKEGYRLKKLRSTWEYLGAPLDIKFLKADLAGRVTVKLCGIPEIADRGSILMRVEADLQTQIPGITLLEQAKGDANKLRLFRGVKPQ